MAKMKFGTVEETVVTREEFPLEKAREILNFEISFKREAYMWQTGATVRSLRPEWN